MIVPELPVDRLEISGWGSTHVLAVPGCSPHFFTITVAWRIYY